MNRMMLTAGVLAAAGLAASASATVLYSTGFEAPTFTAGTFFTPTGSLTGAGPDGWTYGSSTVSDNSSTIGSVAVNAHSGSQYYSVATASFGGTTSASRSAFAYVFNTMPNSALLGKTLHASVFENCVSAGTNTRITGGTFEMFSSTSLIAGIRNQSNGVLAFYCVQPGGALSQIGLSGEVNDHYYQLEMYLDFVTGLASYWVDGISQDSVLDGAGFNRNFDATSDYSDTDLVTSRFASAGSTSTGHVHRWDDMLLEINDSVPAPSSVALMGLGGLLAARRRRA